MPADDDEPLTNVDWLVDHRCRCSQGREIGHPHWIGRRCRPGTGQSSTPQITALATTSPSPPRASDGTHGAATRGCPSTGPGKIRNPSDAERSGPHTKQVGALNYVQKQADTARRSDKPRDPRGTQPPKGRGCHAPGQATVFSNPPASARAGGVGHGSGPQRFPRWVLRHHGQRRQLFRRRLHSGTSTYDFTGVTSPSSTHVALDGEIDETDAVIENGTFGARRDTITGWANWGEATSGEYSNLVTSDNLYYQGLDPGSDDNAAMLFELTAGEDPSCVARIDVTVEGAQGGSSGSDLLFVYLWDYNTGSYLVGGSMNGTTDQVVSFSVTANPGDYVQAADGQMTVFVVNEDTSDWIRIDRITVDVAVDASADLTGTLVPSALEGEIVAGGETLIITLTNDSWDPTVGADNAITTALINGIDSAQGEATGWDAAVKANLDFNDVTRTSPFVVTVTLGAEPTYQITAAETITVTVPASAVAGGETLVITLTNDTWDPTVGADNAITTAVINGIDSAQSEGTGWDAVVKAGLTFNEATRTSSTVVTITLPAFATFDVGAASAALSGTLVPSALEGEIVAGAETLVITLTNDTWDSTVGANNAITTAVINGIDSAQAEGTGWDAVVKAGLTFNEVVRTSNTVVTVTLPAFATYGITADETIEVTVPATAVTGNAIVAAPTFNVITRFSAALTSVADTDGEENDADKNFGTGVEMRVQSKAGGTNHRSFGRFDVSSIPAGSTIDSATLTLCAADTQSSPRTYDVHRVTASWVETTLTWNNQPGVVAAATDSATTPISPVCMTWTVTADVQAWVDGTANNGWRVADSVEEGSDYLAKFHTRENGESAQRPKLDVVYFAP